MSYTVTITRKFKAVQGLKSPIRQAKGQAPLQPTDGYDITLHVSVTFAESQLNDRGWFIDTDSLDDIIDALCTRLSSAKWTELFEFRPTFELVARWIFQQLAPQIPQLTQIMIENHTLGASTTYTAPTDTPDSDP
jgi:6-pyruvoyltetrahydropterin/6-carboxytetrahydropterin synthase